MVNIESTIQTTPPILQVGVDADDCLYPTTGPLPPNYHPNYETLSEFIGFGNEGGVPIGIFSGREINYIVGATRSLGAPNCWSILENGLCLYNLATEERRDHPLLTTGIEAIFQAIRQYVIPHIISRFPELVPYLRKEIHIALERSSPKVKLVDYVGPVTEMLSEFSEFIDIVLSSNAIDILIKGVNKGSGMLWLCEQKDNDISPENILVIGDSFNDVPAMEIAGYIACPANATITKYVQEKGGYVSPYLFVIGVVDAIVHFLDMTN